MQAISLYFHIPFCVQRCHYCDFNTVAGSDSLIPEYVKALCIEIDVAGRNIPDSIPVHSIYFGGGTPSILRPKDLNKILDSIKGRFNLLADLEMTIEANPGTLSLDYLKALRYLGFNRLSLGAQSAVDAENRILGRIHQYEDVKKAMAWARLCGFMNINLDLIYGIPTQTLDSWFFSLREIVNLEPEHLSLYALTLEEDVPMFRMIRNGELFPQDEDLMAEMYEKAEDYLSINGFEHYEISNWCKKTPIPGLFQSRHNLQYWRSLPYLGMGAGAHGYFGGFRTANVKDIRQYIQKCLQCSDSPTFSPAIENAVRISLWDEIQEYLMVGLRLIEEGISFENFSKRFGQSLQVLFHQQLDDLVKKGLIEINEARVRLTPRGRLLGNQVFMQFIGNQEPENLS